MISTTTHMRELNRFRHYVIMLYCVFVLHHAECFSGANIYNLTYINMNFSHSALTSLDRNYIYDDTFFPFWLYVNANIFFFFFYEMTFSLTAQIAVFARLIFSDVSILLFFFKMLMMHRNNNERESDKKSL